MKSRQFDSTILFIVVTLFAASVCTYEYFTLDTITSDKRLKAARGGGTTGRCKNRGTRQKTIGIARRLVNRNFHQGVYQLRKWLRWRIRVGGVRVLVRPRPSWIVTRVTIRRGEEIPAGAITIPDQGTTWNIVTLGRGRPRWIDHNGNHYRYPSMPIRYGQSNGTCSSSTMLLLTRDFLTPIFGSPDWYGDVPRS